MKKFAICFSVFIFYSTSLLAAYPNDIDPVLFAVAQKQALLAVKDLPPATAPTESSVNNDIKNHIDPRLTGKEIVEQTDDGFLRILNHQESNFDMQFKLNIQGNTINVTEKLTDISGPDPDIDTDYTYTVGDQSYTLTKREWYGVIDQLYNCYTQEEWAATLGKVYGDYTKGLGGNYNAQTIMELYMQKVYIPQNIPNWEKYNIVGVANDYLAGNRFQKLHQIAPVPSEQKKTNGSDLTGMSGNILGGLKSLF